MRILLAQNSLYYPAHGGGDKSNRLLIEALAALGHECRVVARISVFGAAEQQLYLDQLAQRGVAARESEPGVVAFTRAGVAVSVVTNANLRTCFASVAARFDPDIVLVSTDDPAQLLLEAALRFERARIVYLARATLAVPFGPDCAFPSEAKAARIRAASLVVGVSEYVAAYIRRWGGMDAVHVPISLPDPGDPPDLGRWDSEFVTLVNPCAVKGIAIFLALADALPGVRFAAVPTWGTNCEDREALERRPNIELLKPVDDINLLLARTRVLLVPSLWAEARSRIVLEAELRGVPVMAADVGGIGEAKLGVPYLLPVSPITKYAAKLDDQMVPIAEVPAQRIGPWCEALDRLLTDRAHWEEVARASRRAALAYAKSATAEPFARLLEAALHAPKPAVSSTAPAAAPSAPVLSDDKRRLLALRLRQRAPRDAWFPGAASASAPRLFCLPHAGGGATAFAGWNIEGLSICAARLPGRETRYAEAPFGRMESLVEALAGAIEPYLQEPYALFGHSMGAVAAFELARLLRRRGLALPRAIVASSARGPRFRRNHVPPPDPDEATFLEELRRLGGVPAEAMEDPAVLRAILPALMADAALYRRYVYTEDAPLPVPIFAYGGESDANITLEHLEAWGEETTDRFAVRRFAGGHFYFQKARREFLAALESDLTGLVIRQ